MFLFDATSPWYISLNSEYLVPAERSPWTKDPLEKCANLQESYCICGYELYVGEIAQNWCMKYSKPHWSDAWKSLSVLIITPTTIIESSGLPQLCPSPYINLPLQQSGHANNDSLCSQQLMLSSFRPSCLLSKSNQSDSLPYILVKLEFTALGKRRLLAPSLPALMILVRVVGSLHTANCILLIWPCLKCIGIFIAQSEREEICDQGRCQGTEIICIHGTCR